MTLVPSQTLLKESLHTRPTVDRIMILCVNYNSVNERVTYHSHRIEQQNTIYKQAPALHQFVRCLVPFCCRIEMDLDSSSIVRDITELVAARSCTSQNAARKSTVISVDVLCSEVFTNRYTFSPRSISILCGIHVCLVVQYQICR